MVTQIPQNWRYTDDLEMLFLFYQCADELTSEHTSDTYIVPLHNALTLTYEMKRIYERLEEYQLLDSYYENYISVIIEEFLENLKDDKLLKGILGMRLESICSGFESAKKNPVLLERWINLVHQNCDMQKYINLYKKEIVSLVENTNQKRKLIECTKRLFSSLIFMGYSREYIYLMTKKYFNNYSIEISNKEQIRDYLKMFSCKKKQWEFLILIDLNSIEYLDSISDNLTISRNINKVNIDEEREKLIDDANVESLFKQYDTLFHNKSTHQKITIIKYESYSLDQFKAIEEFEDYVRFVQAFSIYFKHHKIFRQIFKVLLKNENGKYQEVKMPDRLLKRPYIKQEVIDYRIESILKAKGLSRSAFISLTEAIAMHSEALDSQDVNTLIKSLWTSLETLFSTLGSNEIKTGVIESALVIIQKTYILKLLRNIYSQISSIIAKDILIEIRIDNFNKFLEYFVSNEAENMRDLYENLDNNLLLRTRVFELRKNLDDADKIRQCLDKHEHRIRWQLQRIYRTRNIATHLGMDMYYSDIIINHLHNYFDFIINYILCKICNGDYVCSVAAVVFEAKNDNSIQKEILKTKDKLSLDNYQQLIFGPDKNLIDYEFEG